VNVKGGIPVNLTLNDAGSSPIPSALIQKHVCTTHLREDGLGPLVCGQTVMGGLYVADRLLYAYTILSARYQDGYKQDRPGCL
jgi:hypothetical protein